MGGGSVLAWTVTFDPEVHTGDVPTFKEVGGWPRCVVVVVVVVVVIIVVVVVINVVVVVGCSSPSSLLWWRLVVFFVGGQTRRKPVGSSPSLSLWLTVVHVVPFPKNTIMVFV